MTLSLSAQTRLLVVAPHPDDETIATGVLIQQVLAAGGSVRLLLLTDGDNNPWPQRWLERRLRIRPSDRKRWAQRRREELHRAMACLGLAPAALTALGWADQGLTARVQQACAASVACLRGVLAQAQPTLVVMPVLDDRHPDHSAAHVLMRLALAAGEVSPECQLYRVHGTVPAGAGGTVLPVADGMAARKIAALSCHASQLALSGARMQRLAARPERFEPLPVSAHADLPWRPARVSWPWITLTVADRDNGSVRPWSQVAWHRSGSGGYRLPAEPGQGASPRFAKLQSALPSPWIFDHWGWCELIA